MRVYAPLNRQEFTARLKETVAEHAEREHDGSTLAKLDFKDEDFKDRFQVSCQELVMLSDRVERDLRKVRFDCENSGISGLHDLGGGLLVLLCWAGGDWELPVSFCLYWSGKEIRAYIPHRGNPWYRKKKRAYHASPDGSDEIADRIRHGFSADRQEGHIDSDDPRFLPLMLGDIKEHIVLNTRARTRTRPKTKTKTKGKTKPKTRR